MVTRGQSQGGSKSASTSMPTTRDAASCTRKSMPPGSRVTAASSPRRLGHARRRCGPDWKSSEPLRHASRKHVAAVSRAPRAELRVRAHVWAHGSAGDVPRPRYLFEGVVVVECSWAGSPFWVRVVLSSLSALGCADDLFQRSRLLKSL
jgi:hypothetical protein